MRERLSLRARLLIAVGVIALVALVIADVVVYVSIRSSLYQQVDASLEASHRAVEASADNPQSANAPPGGGTPSGSGPPPGASSSAFCAVGRESAPGMFIEVLDKEHKVVTGAAGLEECAAFQPGSKTYKPALPPAITGFRTTAGDPNEPTVYFTAPSSSAGGPDFRVRASILDNRDVLIVAEPIGNITDTLSRLFFVELGVTLGALLAATLLGFWLVRLGLRPLNDIEQTADSIAEGDLAHRAPHAEAPTEVGHLARAFNVMLDRIQCTVTELSESEDRLRRFVGDASHELRTPTAAVSAYAQLFNHGIAHDPDELARVMQGIQRESGRMSQLIEDLHVLAKLDEGRALASDPVDLVDLVFESADAALVVGPAWPIEIVADEAVEALGDRGALRQVVDNLLSNVRSHTPAGTLTTVTITRDGDSPLIEVHDDGPGFTDEQAEHLFERFFRVDASRVRVDGGGSGLGLSIVAAIVAAHGGRVDASSGPDGGATMTVRLPARPLLPPSHREIREQDHVRSRI